MGPTSRRGGTGPPGPTHRAPSPLPAPQVLELEPGPVDLLRRLLVTLLEGPVHGCPSILRIYPACERRRRSFTADSRPLRDGYPGDQDHDTRRGLRPFQATGERPRRRPQGIIQATGCSTVAVNVIRPKSWILRFTYNLGGDLRSYNPTTPVSGRCRVLQNRLL